MRPQQALGRPGTPVIPPTWSDAPRAVMGKTRTGTCELRHPGTVLGDFNTTTGTYPDATDAPVYWSGSCRVQAVPVMDGHVQDAAGEAVTTLAYLVTVDLHADDPADEIRVDDILRVTAIDDNGDPSLIGRGLTLTSIARGTLAWERDLVCVDQLDRGAE